MTPSQLITVVDSEYNLAAYLAAITPLACHLDKASVIMNFVTPSQYEDTKGNLSKPLSLWDAMAIAGKGKMCGLSQAAFESFRDQNISTEFHYTDIDRLT